MNDVIFPVLVSTFVDLFSRNGADVDLMETVAEPDRFRVCFHNELSVAAVFVPHTKVGCIFLLERARREVARVVWRRMTEIGLPPHIALDAVIALDWVDECEHEDILTEGPVDEDMWDVLHKSQDAGRIHFDVAELRAKIERGAA